MPDTAFFVSKKSFVSKHFIDSTVSPPVPTYVTQNLVIHDNVNFYCLLFCTIQVQLSWDFNLIQ